MDNCGNKLPFSYNLSHKNIITKLPESGMFCEYITEYITDSGVVKVHMTLGGGNPSTTQTKSYFVFISYIQSGGTLWLPPVGTLKGKMGTHVCSSM